MSYYTLAFFMGFFGSFHCVAMCGPLMLALPLPHRARWKVLANLMFYQVGRVSMYAFLGLLIGFVGSSFAIKGWQQIVSVVSGLLLIGMGLLSIWGQYMPFVTQMQGKLTKPLTKWIGYWLYRPGGHLVVGALNGLLPCGMVYMALAAALSTDSIQGGGLFMLLFGLGTWPAMLLVSVVGNTVKRYVPRNLTFWLPVMYLLMGGWFMLRGANLDIPFLSPLIYPKGAMMCG